jgi:hypothetical protein
MIVLLRRGLKKCSSIKKVIENPSIIVDPANRLCHIQTGASGKTFSKSAVMTAPANPAAMPAIAVRSAVCIRQILRALCPEGRA